MVLWYVEKKKVEINNLLILFKFDVKLIMITYEITQHFLYEKFGLCMTNSLLFLFSVIQLLEWIIVSNDEMVMIISGLLGVAYSNILIVVCLFFQMYDINLIVIPLITFSMIDLTLQLILIIEWYSIDTLSKDQLFENDTLLWITFHSLILNSFVVLGIMVYCLKILTYPLIKPLDQPFVQQLAIISIKPLDNTLVKPLDNTLVKPLDNTLVKPLDNPLVKPLDNTLAKPLQSIGQTT